MDKAEERSYVRIGGITIHRAWIMLAGCSILTAGTLGAIFGGCGVFYVPICADLGFARNEIAAWQQAHFLSMIPAMPLAGKLLERFDLRVVMSVSAVACALAAGLMSTYDAVWQWVCSGVVYGTFGSCLMQLPQAAILGNWFQRKTGLAMGVATAVGSIGSAVFAPMFAHIIMASGWRTAYVVQGIIVAACSLPFTLFLFRLRPADIGALPYGYDPRATPGDATGALPAQRGVPLRRGLPSLAFVMVFLFAGAAALIGSGFDAHLPGYAESVGHSALFGGSLVSALQLGSFCEKLIMGWANDRFGIERTVYLEFVVVAAGMVGLVVFRSEWAMLASAFLFGVQDSFTSISLPLLLRRFFGERDFTQYYAWARIGSGIFGSFGSRLVGLSFDLTASFAPAFLLAIGLCALGAAFVTIARASARRLPWTDAENQAASVEEIR